MTRRWAHVPGVEYPAPMPDLTPEQAAKVGFGLNAEQARRIRALDAQGHKLSAICAEIGTSIQSVSRYLRSIGRARRIRRYGKRRAPLQTPSRDIAA
jgi:hypothetical protein